MSGIASSASGRPWIGRPDVVWCILVVVLAVACDEGAVVDRAESLELDADTVQLSADVEVADVALRAGARPRAEPDTVRVRTGDAVRFTAADALTHTVSFDRDRLPAPAVDFLARTGQLRSPPLLVEGARWIISLEGAPPGTYPFVDAAHGIGGVMVVRRRDATPE